MDDTFENYQEIQETKMFYLKFNFI